jgi:hypothetical protein
MLIAFFVIICAHVVYKLSYGEQNRYDFEVSTGPNQFVHFYICNLHRKSEQKIYSNLEVFLVKKWLEFKFLRRRVGLWILN